MLQSFLSFVSNVQSAERSSLSLHTLKQLALLRGNQGFTDWFRTKLAEPVQYGADGKTRPGVKDKPRLDFSWEKLKLLDPTRAKSLNPRAADRIQRKAAVARFAAFAGAGAGESNGGLGSDADD